MSAVPGQVEAFGDRALLVRTGDVATAHGLARRVRAAVADDGPAADRPPGPVEEVVVGHGSLLVVLGPDPGRSDLDATRSWLVDLAADAGDVPADAGGVTTHHLPVAFDGPDLGEVADALGATTDDVVALLVGVELEVAFIGFAPGFPYLTGLPGPLAAVPRRATPRTAVPAGSVAVAGGFAAVYPRATPGGWNVLGRTGVVLFDPDRPPHTLIAPGDRVRFVAASGPVPAASPGVPRPLLDAGRGPALVVEAAGPVDLVQDAGRTGAAAHGVPRSGAADPRALVLANLLLGNDPAAAGVESTGTGPAVRVVGRGHVAVVGAAAGAVEVRVDGHRAPDAAVVPVDDGQVVSVGPVRRGLRAYLAVAGGLETPQVFGSRSSDVLAGLGPGRLRTGDRLARGVPGRARGTLHHPSSGSGSAVSLRVVPGPHTGAPDGGAGPVERSAGDGGFARLVASPWRVGVDGDRVGVRLEPADGGVAAARGRTVASTPMVTGAVQVPPDGRPIVLLPDHATVGGYPVVACVITADLALLGQLAPGDTVVFVPVDLAAARAALVRTRQSVGTAVAGWYPTATGT